MVYMFTFFTHSGAIKFDRRMNKKDVNCQLMPVPRSLSSNCGFCAKVEYKLGYQDLVDEEVEKIYEYDKDKCLLVFQNE